MSDILKCLFPVAGYGTRFLPATKAMPKEMLPILNKPLIEYGVSEAKEAGCITMAMVTGRNKRAIEDHFDKNYELEHKLEGSEKTSLLKSINSIIDECDFTYIRQKEMLGLGHAVLTGHPLIGNEPFGVILSDDMCVCDDLGVMSQMVKVYEKYKKSVVAIEEIDLNSSHKYGIIEGNEIEDGVFELTSLIEKPSSKDAPSNLAVVGRYVLTPDIFDILRTTKPGIGGEIQLTDALLNQAKNGGVLGYKFKGRRFDCGSVGGFVKATNYLYAIEKN